MPLVLRRGKKRIIMVKRAAFNGLNEFLKTDSENENNEDIKHQMGNFFIIPSAILDVGILC